MSETTVDVRSLPKKEGYRIIAKQLDALLVGQDPIAAMATVSCVLHFGFGHLWTGFYRVVEPGLLRVGPYQGSLGCLEIRFGQGVCGKAAADKKTVIVPDVHRFPGHITCDSRAASEIVVPVTDERGELIAVLDIDSDRQGTFDEEDQHSLEELIGLFRT
jgi:L-methionine (R)-S-oxide reductase